MIKRECCLFKNRELIEQINKLLYVLEKEEQENEFALCSDCKLKETTGIKEISKLHDNINKVYNDLFDIRDTLRKLKYS